MAKAPATFKNAADWEKKYRPIEKSSGIRTRCGGTLFDRFGEDRKFVDRMEREFIWSVFDNSTFEYIQSGKQDGDTVIGYIVTDYPVMFADKDSLFAINYEKIAWDAFECKGGSDNSASGVNKDETLAPVIAKPEAMAEKPGNASIPVKKQAGKEPAVPGQLNSETLKRSPTPGPPRTMETRMAGKDAVSTATKVLEKVFAKVKLSRTEEVREDPRPTSSVPAATKSVAPSPPIKRTSSEVTPDSRVQVPAARESRKTDEMPQSAPLPVPAPNPVMVSQGPTPQTPAFTAKSMNATEAFQLVSDPQKPQRPAKPIRPHRGPKPKPVEIPATPPSATPAADPRPAPPAPQPAVIRVSAADLAGPKPVAIPPSAPKATPAAEPLPAPTPPRPTVIRVSKAELEKAKPMEGPSSAPAVTPASEPKPAPLKAAPSSRKTIMRYLPLGRDETRRDLAIFGIWPDGVLCKHCGGSGFFAGVQVGLLECEECEGRGWNPRPGTALEYEVIRD